MYEKSIVSKTSHRPQKLVDIRFEPIDGQRNRGLGGGLARVVTKEGSDSITLRPINFSETAE